MAKKKTVDYKAEMPATLDEHMFYDLKLDEYQTAFRDAI